MSFNESEYYLEAKPYLCHGSLDNYPNRVRLIAITLAVWSEWPWIIIEEE